MKETLIDIETYCEADIKKCGLYRYVSDPSFEILLIAWATDEGEGFGETKLADLASGDPFPKELLDDFKDGHPYFFYLWLDWSNRLKQATPDCKNPTKLLPHKELAHVPSNLATMQQQILRLFQTVLDAGITDIDFSVRVQAYEQAPSLQKFDFQPMKISFEFVEEKQFAEVLYPQNMYDLIDFSLRE